MRTGLIEGGLGEAEVTVERGAKTDADERARDQCWIAEIAADVEALACVRACGRDITLAVSNQCCSEEHSLAQ